MRPRGVQTEAADFLVRELVVLRRMMLVGRHPRVVPPHEPGHGAEVDDRGRVLRHVDGCDGVVVLALGRGVQLDGFAGAQVERADGRVVRGRQEGVAVAATAVGEEKGADGARVQLEGRDGRSVVPRAFLLVFVRIGFPAGGDGLRPVEDPEVAEFVAGEDEGFVPGRMKGQGVLGVFF